MGWSELRIHAWLAREPRPRGLAGSAQHDAAVLRAWRGCPVACVDATIEGVHVDARASARATGRKAVARALSDLAASAARPRAVLLSISAPRERADAWIRSAIRGARAVAREHGADLVGGDLSCCPGPARLVVTALGSHAGAGTPPGRDRARAGDVVLLTGPVGGSLLGRHLRIAPRIEWGIWLARRGARALMDVSDGLALDLARLARAARVRVDLDVEAVPIHRDARRRARASGRTALFHALHDGEDHELIACVPARLVPELLRAARRHCPTLRVVGGVRRGSGLWLRAASGKGRRFDPREGGYRHGD